ncbi:MarR family winged helix-turn-helix transcriptional regulator [Streptomyces sp. NPDC005132]|uniref:MarR family winged helix-turn-helix transcriptional regulator n=1 Tax=Streptomyces sp. NPDC005132 TaxID=3154294 RepID=UPI0033ACCF2B
MSDPRRAPEVVGLRYLSLAYRLGQTVDGAMARDGLSLARTRVLEVLNLRGAVRQSVLAQALGQAPRSVTQSVEALEHRGLVARTPDPDDGRCKLVRLTAQGSTALLVGVAARERALRAHLGTLKGRELSDLNRLLDRLQDGLLMAADDV